MNQNPITPDPTQSMQGMQPATPMFNPQFQPQQIPQQMPQFQPQQMPQMQQPQLTPEELMMLLQASQATQPATPQLQQPADMSALGQFGQPMSAPPTGAISQQMPSAVSNIPGAEVNPELQQIPQDVLQTPTEQLASNEPDIAQTLRGTKGMTAEDIMQTYPNIQLKRDVPITDVFGNKTQIEAGEALTPYELKGNKILLQDGNTYLVSKNQYQNIKGQSNVAEAKEFAPELQNYQETIRGAKNYADEFDYEELPPEVRAIINKYPEETYEDNDAMIKELNKIGWTADYDLTGEITSFSKLSEGEPTKYEEHTLPGGENYKEILIQAPKEETKTPAEIAKETYNKDWESLTESEKQIASNKAMTQSQYKSGHWEEPNVLAHLRLNNRDYNGKKVTFMEELQSDWARESKAGKAPENSELKNWQEKSIKRALKEAVDDGSDYFAWISGNQTGERYGLSTHIAKINWEPEESVRANDIGGVTHISLQTAPYINPMVININKNGIVIDASPTLVDATGKSIDELLGEGFADKIMEQTKGELSGGVLKFGGEWANNLYDKQVKSLVEKLTGQNVEKIKLSTGDQMAIKLTPEVKAKIKGEAPEIKTSGNKFGEIPQSPEQPEQTEQIKPLDKELAMESHWYDTPEDFVKNVEDRKGLSDAELKDIWIRDREETKKLAEAMKNKPEIKLDSIKSLLNKDWIESNNIKDADSYARAISLQNGYKPLEVDDKTILFKGTGGQMQLGYNKDNMKYWEKLSDSKKNMPENTISFANNYNKAAEYGKVKSYTMKTSDILNKEDYKKILTKTMLQDKMADSEKSLQESMQALPSGYSGYWRRADKLPSLIENIKKAGYKAFTDTNGEIVVLDRSAVDDLWNKAHIDQSPEQPEQSQ